MMSQGASVERGNTYTCTYRGEARRETRKLWEMINVHVAQRDKEDKGVREMIVYMYIHVAQERQGMTLYMWLRKNKESV